MTETLPLEGMPRPLFACTPSLLTTWLDCPRRYRMTYLDRPPPPKGPPWAHNALGSTVHNALRMWVTGPRERRTPDGARAAVDVQWLSEGYRDDAQEEHWRDRAREMVAAYVETLDPDDEPAGVERTVAVPYAGMALRGRVDRIDLRGDEAVVVDYKTGRHVPSEQDARGSLALAVYAVAVQKTLRRRARRVELHHVPTGTVVAWEHDDTTLARHLRRAADIAEEARAAVEAHKAGQADDTTFPARPSPQCQWCDFLRVCEAGRSTATPRRPWDALEQPAKQTGGFDNN